MINLVCTRATRGEHEQLVRWYADHVHQLLAFPGLRGAALHRRRGDHDTAPEYLCLYDFADRAAFEAYERGDVHKNAAKDRTAGWGRDGIEITLRTQYERLYWCASSADDGQQVQVHAVRAAPAAERGLAAQAIERKASAHALLRALTAPSPLADYLLIEHTPATTSSLQGVEVAWQGGYERLRRWWR